MEAARVPPREADVAPAPDPTRRLTHVTVVCVRRVHVTQRPAEGFESTHCAQQSPPTD